MILVSCFLNCVGYDHTIELGYGKKKMRRVVYYTAEFELGDLDG
jgi:hypothetical protein